MRVFNNIIGICQVQKWNEERKECEEKEKKRKDVRGDEHIKGCGNQILKSRAFLDLKLKDFVDHKGLYMWEISCHLDMYWKRSKYLKFQPQFWSQFLLKVITLCNHQQ